MCPQVKLPMPTPCYTSLVFIRWLYKAFNSSPWYLTYMQEGEPDEEYHGPCDYGESGLGVL